SAYLDGTRVWVGTGSTLYVGDPPYTTWTPLATGHRINALLRTGTRLWAASDTGLIASDDEGMTFQPAGTVTIFAESLALLPDGSLAVGTAMGLVISDPTRTSFAVRSPAVTDI